jgi:excinuclease UvrABC helicase subunit UvrB
MTPQLVKGLAEAFSRNLLRSAFDVSALDVTNVEPAGRHDEQVRVHFWNDFLDEIVVCRAFRIR